MSDMKGLLKIIIGIFVFAVCAPAILSILGFVVKGLVWVIMVVAIIIGILYIIYKIKYKSPSNGFNKDDEDEFYDSSSGEDSSIDDTDSEGPIVDVYDYKEDNKDDK